MRHEEQIPGPPGDGGIVTGAPSRWRTPAEQLRPEVPAAVVDALAAWIEARRTAAGRADRWWYLSGGRELDGRAYAWACVPLEGEVVAVRQVVCLEDGTWRRYAYDEVVEDDAGFLTDQAFGDDDLAGTGDVQPLDPAEFAALWERAGGGPG
ncbi:hypothetical protein ACFVTZ_01615 [Cellulosimicrobium cellulans]|uniref:hypothetical protein n=1 Tax=Cellulosimicrobium cellulans TaxID=1710 RepID=UPI0036E499F6